MDVKCFAVQINTKSPIGFRKVRQAKYNYCESCQNIVL